MATMQTLFGIPYKYVSLLTLVLQNSTLVIVLHYSRIMVPKDQQYFTSTAVFLAELIKLIISLYFAIQAKIKDTGAFNLLEFYYDIFTHDTWKLMVPAALYTIQNNLQYVAVSLLDAATFSVTYQLKILTTALFSVIMLRRSLTMLKWMALVLLTIGVALVQMPSNKPMDPATQMDDDASMERIVGLGAVAVACTTSGIAGVYFEKVLKGTRTSIWVRNTQLSFFSLFTALIMGVWWKDGTGVAENGFFYGYNLITWSAIACQAIGGIIVALVVKYADNILKGFATSISIILSSLASLFIFTDTNLSSTFLIGAIFVLAATYIYSVPDAPTPVKQKAQVPSNASSKNQGDDEETGENDQDIILNGFGDGYSRVAQVEEKNG